VVELLLRRAEAPAEEAERLTAQIADLEQRELMRSVGRVEPRHRFRGGNLVRVNDDARHLLSIDESGKSVAGGTQWFALGAVAMTGGAAQAYRARADALKVEFFGRSEITFHEPEMRRRENVFYLGGDGGRQLAFDRALDRLLGDTDFTVFGVGIRKEAFAGFLRDEIDPYLPVDVYAVAIHLLMERYVDYRAASGAPRSLTKVIFESQGAKEDAIHQREYADLLLNGTQWVPSSAFQGWLETGVEFRPKQGSDPIEISDMLSRDLYEWLQAGCEGSPGRWGLFTQRTYCRDDGEMGKFGLKVFPDSDIRERILEHRRAAGRHEEAPAPEGDRRR
jgi:hypothetical protein